MGEIGVYCERAVWLGDGKDGCGGKVLLKQVERLGAGLVPGPRDIFFQQV